MCQGYRFFDQRTHFSCLMRRVGGDARFRSLQVLVRFAPAWTRGRPFCRRPRLRRRAAFGVDHFWKAVPAKQTPNMQQWWDFTHPNATRVRPNHAGRRLP